MRKVRCRSCDSQLGVDLQIVAFRKGQGARQWYVQVCADCWRAWEALLDQAAIGVQQGLETTQIGFRGWFL